MQAATMVPGSPWLPPQSAGGLAILLQTDLKPEILVPGAELVTGVCPL